jgi:hypothetical protein
MTSIHQEKDQKPTQDKPNINTIDFQENFKNFIRQIKERQQLFMKTIERYASQYLILKHVTNFYCR